MKRFDWDIFFAFAALIVITVFAGRHQRRR
jgi:hypothetical protein